MHNNWEQYSTIASRHRLCSANRHRLIVPRCRLNTYGRRAFPVAGPMVWNSLPDELKRSGMWCRQLQTVLLKQSCSALTSVTTALEVIFNVMRSINPHFTLLTYFTHIPCSNHAHMRWKEQISLQQAVWQVWMCVKCNARSFLLHFFIWPSFP